MHIITISRQFGSGGRELGKRLADRLGWDYYDREIIDSIARDHGLDPGFVKAAFANHGWHNVPLTYRSSFSHLLFDPAPDTELLIRERETLRGIAELGNNCIIIGRAEAFCQKNPVGPSFFDGIFQGLGYTLVLICMCVIRELLGKGTFGAGIFNTVNGIGTGEGIRIFPAEYGALVITLPIGGFITLGCLIALMQYVLKRSEKKKEAAEKEAIEA